MIPLPILMQILQGAAATGGAAMRAVPSIAKFGYERANEDEVARLKHLREAGNLGLSPAEKQRLFAEQAASAENQLQKANQQLGQLAASDRTQGAGKALATQAQVASTGAKIKGEINRNVEALNQAKADKQEQEYWARLAADSEAKKARTAAWMSIPATGLEALSGATSVNATVQPKVSTANLKGIQSQYNLDDTQFNELMKAVEQNPALLENLKALM